VHKLNCCTLLPSYGLKVFSTANQDSLVFSGVDDFASVFKLHGDYRYDKIKNTSSELQALEQSMNQQFEARLKRKGLVFIGYSGCDGSIMNVLENNIENAGFLPYGLTWMIPVGAKLSDRVNSLMEKACTYNESSCVIEIPSFDEFLYSCYQLQCTKNTEIEKRWLDYPKRKKNISFTSPYVDYFIKTNTFISKEYPLCRTFDTNITSWDELKKVLEKSNLIAALFSGKIYCFDDIGEIQQVFASHICSEILEENVPNKILYKDDSIFTGMLYKLIKKTLIEGKKLIAFDRNKYYIASSLSIYDSKYHVYDGMELVLSFLNGKYHLSIVPTVFAECIDGRSIDKVEKQILINKIMSTLYNNKYDEKLKFWNVLLKNHITNDIAFGYKGFTLRFIPIFLSSGGADRHAEWPQVHAHQFPEPEMVFSAVDSSCKGINQLKGIVRYAPIDYSYSTDRSIRTSIKVAIISPQQHVCRIISHLNSLNQNHPLRNGGDGFLPLYESFEKIYKRGLLIPSESDNSKCFLYDEASALMMNIPAFVSMIKTKVDQCMIQFTDADLLIVYIPKSLSRFRESNDPLDDFNLHDAIKLYATDKGIKLQFIEERSINTYDPCKVMWGLSTSIYAKSSGILWHPNVLNNDTAFVGVSYAQSKKRGICIGCSQLFDSTGTGMRLILRKLNEPRYFDSKHKSPYMGCDEARQMMSTLREQYYKCDPVSRLNRIVVHKTTPFTSEEIRGFTQALEGIDDVELLQIQEFSPWKAIRYKEKAADGAYGFPVKRGTVIPLSNDSFLIWTHGSVMHNELKGNLNYYKGGRGVPAPLMVKRFYGKASGDVIASEILMLSKMNWNSGDSLYKMLPVTLDFAKTLSRMAKQDEAIYNKAYDFRYFM
jgi:hypothetical protein